jgi:hypothetical protein
MAEGNADDTPAAAPAADGQDAALLPGYTPYCFAGPTQELYPDATLVFPATLVFEEPAEPGPEPAGDADADADAAAEAAAEAAADAAADAAVAAAYGAAAGVMAATLVMDEAGDFELQQGGEEEEAQAAAAAAAVDDAEGGMPGQHLEQQEQQQGKEVAGSDADGHITDNVAGAAEAEEVRGAGGCAGVPSVLCALPPGWLSCVP